jgi:hypothetical protein
MKRPSRAEVAARKAEIARRYSRKKERKPFNLAVLRAAELRRIFKDRYGDRLPMDREGRQAAFLMAHALAWRPDAHRKIPAWLSLWAPWMNDAPELTAKALSKPLKWSADKLGAKLGLTDADRIRLKIRTIGAVDCRKEARVQRRMEAKEERRVAKRRAAGTKPRAEYEASSLGKSRPWEALGISRATWFRRFRKAATSAPPTPIVEPNAVEEAIHGLPRPWWQECDKPAAPWDVERAEIETSLVPNVIGSITLGATPVSRQPEGEELWKLTLLEQTRALGGDFEAMKLAA